jgi:23S rRNA (guanosine2251-2'-O)-methyltransferase
MTDDYIIAGVNPVREALRHRGAECQGLYIASERNGSAIQDIIDLARKSGLKPDFVERSRLDRLYGGSRHQGVILKIAPLPYAPLEELLESALSRPRSLILMLDGVQDPVNFGALLRTADAAGVCGVIVPRERSAPLSPVAVKASSGAAEYVPVVRVINLARTLDELKEAGFWAVGADADADHKLYHFEFNEKTVLVLGGEGQGLRRLIKLKCDHLVSIPMFGHINSLNVSVAGAIAMFEFIRQGDTNCQV